MVDVLAARLHALGRKPLETPGVRRECGAEPEWERLPARLAKGLAERKAHAPLIPSSLRERLERVVTREALAEMTAHDVDGDLRPTGRMRRRRCRRWRRGRRTALQSANSQLTRSLQNQQG